MSHKYSSGVNSEGTFVYDFIISVTDVSLSKLGANNCQNRRYDGKERSPSIDAVLSCDKG